MMRSMEGLTASWIFFGENGLTGRLRVKDATTGETVLDEEKNAVFAERIFHDLVEAGVDTGDMEEVLKNHMETSNTAFMEKAKQELGITDDKLKTHAQVVSYARMGGGQVAVMVSLVPLAELQPTHTLVAALSLAARQLGLTEEHMAPPSKAVLDVLRAYCENDPAPVEA